MRASLLALAIVCLASPANAQLVSPLAPPASQSDLTAVQAAVATKCDPMAMVPPTESVGGSAGSGTNCRLANAVQPRISRTVSGTTAANGQAVITWPDMGSVPKLTVTPYVASNETAPFTCYPVIGTVTSTGATIKCYQDQSILGLGLLPRKAAVAGVQFDVLALPAS